MKVVLVAALIAIFAVVVFAQRGGARSSPSRSSPSRSTASRSTASRSSPSRSTASRSSPSRSTASRSSPSRSTASRSTPSRSTASRSSPSRSTASRSTASRSTPSRSTASRSTPSRSTASRSTASRSTPSRSTASKTAPKTSARQTAPKQTAPKKSAPRQTAPKQTAPRQTAPKQTAPKQTAPKQTAPQTAGKYKVDHAFIAKQEGMINKMYVPMNKQGQVIGKSGATIANGLDLGQRNNLNDLKANGLSPATAAKLTPYLGKTKDAAASYVKSHPLTLSKAEGAEVANAVSKTYDGRVAQSFNKLGGAQFSSLPSNVQTALASVAHQYGSLQAPAVRGVANAAKNGDYAGAAKALQNMKGYTNRRNAEAALMRA